MDMKKIQKLPVSFTINDCVETEDSRFLAITIDVLHTGLNFNGSVFSREVVDANADSIMNTPVLGYIALNPDGEYDFQGHEYKMIVTDEGKKYVYAGNAYGVIPESCNYRWIEKVSSDGVSREYFQVDALLWTKFDEAVSIFKRDGGKPQSMELQLASITGDELDDGTFNFTGFKFDGCCLLSSSDETIEPAMIDSVALPTFSVGSIAQDIKNKLNEYSRIINNENDKKEKKTMPNIKDFALTMREQFDEINALLDEHKYTDKWGWECSQYYLVDVQDNELIVVDRADHYRLYGITYSIDGDKVIIDFDKCKRKKTQYVDLENDTDDSGSLDFEKVVSDVADYVHGQLDTVTEEKNTAVQDYTTIKDQYDQMKPEYDKYVSEAQAREAEAIEAAKTAEFEKFDKHLSDNEKYAELKNKRNEYTLEDIQKECAILFTEKNINTDFSKNTNKDKGLTAGIVEDKSHGEINPRYGVLRTK